MTTKKMAGGELDPKPGARKFFQISHVDAGYQLVSWLLYFWSSSLLMHEKAAEDDPSPWAPALLWET